MLKGKDNKVLVLTLSKSGFTKGKTFSSNLNSGLEEGSKGMAQYFCKNKLLFTWMFVLIKLL